MRVRGGERESVCAEGRFLYMYYLYNRLYDRLKRTGHKAQAGPIKSVDDDHEQHLRYIVTEIGL